MNLHITLVLISSTNTVHILQQSEKLYPILTIIISKQILIQWYS